MGARVRGWRWGWRDEAGRASLRVVLLRRWSGGVVVFVDESIEDSLPPDRVDRDRVGGLVVDVWGGVWLMPRWGRWSL